MKTTKWTTPMPKGIVSEFLFEQGILRIALNEVSLPELITKSPIVMDFNKMNQPDMVEPLARQIAMQIHAQEKKFDVIVGGTSPILAFKVASILKLPFLWVVSDKMPTDIIGLKIAIVTDVIMTGKNTAQTLSSLKNNGGKCKDVYSVFDYDFNLTTKGLRDVKLHSLLQVEDLKDLESVGNWKNCSNNLFGNENRKKSVFPLVEK